MKVGLLGAGAIAHRHAEVLGGLSGVEVAAVADTDPSRAGALADRVGALPHPSLQSMFAAAPLDAVFVCTPPAVHAGSAIPVLEQGVPVYLEKPLARTRGDGRAIVDAWRTSGTVCAVGYQWRSLDLVDRLREALAGAAPGMLVSRSIAATESARDDLTQAERGGSWFVDPGQSGGILFELGSHDLDLQVAVAGPAVSVQAISASGLLALAGRPRTALDDAVAVLIRYASGTLGVSVVAWIDIDRPPVHTLDVVAADAALHLTLDPVFRLTGLAHGADVDAAAQQDPRSASVERFLEAVGDGDPAGVPCTPADALVTLDVALAAEQAVMSGRPAKV